MNENICGTAFCPSCLSLIKIILKNSPSPHIFSYICSKPQIHQIMYRLHDANCSHPLTHLDLPLKATWPSASIQSRWGHPAQASPTCLILPSHSTQLSLLAQLHQLSFGRRRVRQFVILSLLIFRALSPSLYLRNKTETSVCKLSLFFICMQECEEYIQYLFTTKNNKRNNLIVYNA